MTTFWTSKFHNIVPKHGMSKKHLQLVEHKMGNSLQFNAIHIAYREIKISGIMWRGVFCAHKPYFLMLGYKLQLKSYISNLICRFKVPTQTCTYYAHGAMCMCTHTRVQMCIHLHRLHWPYGNHFCNHICMSLAY